MTPPTRAELHYQCETFNRRVRVGARVRVRRDDGTTTLTTTRSVAQVLSGHTAVIWLDGIAGCYLLERVTPVRTRSPA